MLCINSVKIRRRFHAKPVLQAQISLGESGKEERDGGCLLDCLLDCLPSPGIAMVSFWLTPEVHGGLISTAASSLTWVLYPIFEEPIILLCLPGILAACDPVQWCVKCTSKYLERLK